ncbi:MFS transporter [Dehalobacterium formicoaceticum]|uniref:MFS transporter n=1 Tax=Dehalobacterium formicoaceticum TaxID=51515 RepID=A0ABT1Y7U3_9FIRM|nr:MFS transporter [Dehalobacterium formicoaceticum]MCR6546960.1 MFS transporter [Dehalobacterium formicoaceticum]
MSKITARIDNLPNTPMMWKILIIVGFGWMFDAMDQGMVAGVMAAIGKDWQISTGQLGLLGSSGMLGMAIGAALSGMAADRWGRKKVITWTLIIFGLASGLSGFSTNFTMLLVLRFITGFGLGGELPAASTLVSEFSPTRVRGRNVIFLESFWAWGWIVASLVAYLLIPVYGWRVAFWIGAVPALFAAYLRRVVPESPRYLEAVGKIEEADALVRRMEEEAGIVCEVNSYEEEPEVVKTQRITFKDLWSKKYIRSTIVLWIIWFGINFGYYGFVLWTPTLLVDRGFDLVKSFEYTLIMCLAQLPGYFSAAFLVERIGRKKVLSVYFAGTAIAAWLFGHAGSTNEVLLFGCLLYFFSLGAWGCVYAYTPEVYPTVARVSGAGWATAFGRVGAFTAPFIVPIIYNYFGTDVGYTYVFIMLTLVFILVALVVAILGKETMGKTLEEISG